MARLDTQINQIYLTNPDGKKISLILHEEQINQSLQLFLIAELFGMAKKAESSDLKKIFEIIAASFRANKKLPAESLFESSLSQINQNLADLAHDGRKSWVGKFSCLICIKAADNNIYLANDGQTSAWLLRKNEFLQILPSEKRGNHPLKTFNNFTQGKLTEGDALVLTTSSVFDYVSFELFTKILRNNELTAATEQISKILKDSMGAEQAFCAFLLGFVKKTMEEPAPIPSADVYALMPEAMDEEPVHRTWKLPAIPKINITLPHLSIPKPSFEWLSQLQFPYFKRLSIAGKFFFLSFFVFLILFIINLGIYGFRLKSKKTQKKIDQLVTRINSEIDQTQSDLIYKDEETTANQLAATRNDFKLLQSMSESKAATLQPKIDQIVSQVDKINRVSDPKTFLSLKRHPIYISKVTNGFLFGNQDSNSLSFYDGTHLTDYFLLNSIRTPITAIAYTTQNGVTVSAASQIYHIDTNLKQLEPLVLLDGNVSQMHSYSNAIYALENNKLVKITSSKGKYQSTAIANGDFSAVRDFGLDQNIYVLYPDKIIKYVAGQAQAFPLPKMSDQLTNGSKIIVAANLNIFEATKKRVVIMNKNGQLLNQIYFPSTNNVTDFAVDEATRSLYLLDDNTLFRITF